MPELRVHCFSVSLDGYGAGPDQALDQPLGVGGEDLHGWFTKTDRFRDMLGEPHLPDVSSIDNQMAEEMWENVGAHVMGRNMFGPVRGEWPDDEWRGWWGEEPPYEHEVFVLTHHARPSVEQGKTTFHFVTEGIEVARERALEAAGGQDVLVAGGASTIRQHLRAGLIDRMQYTVSPVLLGRGERLFEPEDDVAAGYEVTSVQPSGDVTHVTLTKKP